MQKKNKYKTKQMKNSTIMSVNDSFNISIMEYYCRKEKEMNTQNRKQLIIANEGHSGLVG